MVPLNLTRYTLVIILVGVGLALAVFRPQILPVEVEGAAERAMPADEPTPTSISEQPDDTSSVPEGQADSEQESLETERQTLDQEWARLEAEKSKLEQEWVDLAVEKARVTQEGADLQSQWETLVQKEEALKVEEAELAEAWAQLSAEQAVLAEMQEALQAEQALLEDRRRDLQIGEANLQAEKQRVERLRNLSVAAFALGGLVVGLMILLAVVAVWKDKRGRAAASTRKTSGAARGSKPTSSPKSPLSTYGGNGKGRKEVVHTL